MRRVIAACEEVGRDPGTMRFSTAIHCLVGNTHDEAMDRARTVFELRVREETFDDWFAEYAKTRLIGSVEEVAQALRPYAEAGADRVMLMQALHNDLEQIRLIGERLAPLLAG